MVTVDPDAINFIIAKAREIDAKVEPGDPESGSDPSGDRALEELKGAIDGLNDVESRDLVAIMWTGRGDYDKSQWDEAKAQALTIPPRDRSRYLIGTPMLGDYLEQGLDELEVPVDHS